MILLYPKGIRRLLLNGNWQSDVFKMLLVKGSANYTPSVDHEFLSDLGINFELNLANYSRRLLTGKNAIVSPGSNIVNLIASTVDFGNISPVPVEEDHSVKAIVIYRMVGSDDSTPADDDLILYYDGRFRVRLAAPASPSNTTLFVEPLPFGLAANTLLTFTSGQYNLNCVVQSSVPAGSRRVPLSTGAAGNGTILEGVFSNEIILDSFGAKFPFTIGGGNVIVNIPSSGILRVIT